MKNILTALTIIFSSAGSYAQQTSSDTLHWSAARKLEWKDFNSKALAKSGVQGQATFVMNAKYHKGIKATTVVETIFDRQKSYITSEEKTPQMLKYYQTMYDLYEAESRKLRKEFKQTKFGLDPDKVFKEKYTAALAKLAERVDQYTEEAEEGKSATDIDKWSKTIQQELKELE